MCDKLRHGAITHAEAPASAHTRTLAHTIPLDSLLFYFNFYQVV
jgi:hypothetical protein